MIKTINNKFTNKKKVEKGNAKILTRNTRIDIICTYFWNECILSEWYFIRNRNDYAKIKLYFVYRVKKLKLAAAKQNAQNLIQFSFWIRINKIAIDAGKKEQLHRQTLHSIEIRAKTKVIRCEAINSLSEASAAMTTSMSRSCTVSDVVVAQHCCCCCSMLLARRSLSSLC